MWRLRFKFTNTGLAALAFQIHKQRLGLPASHMADTRSGGGRGCSVAVWIASLCNSSFQPPKGPFIHSPVFNLALKIGANFLPAESDQVSEAKELGLL